jgi:hypothetical protein
MALSFGTNTSFMKNAFIDEFQISEVKDVSGITNKWGNTPDLAIEIEYTGNNGKPFNQTIGGNFKVENDKIVGWGKAFPLQLLIEKSVMFRTLRQQDKEDFLTMLELGKIPAMFLNFLKGKRLNKISYVKGFKEDDPTKLAYSTFNQLGWSKEELISSFKRGLTKGFPKNYNPDAIAGPIDTETEGDATFTAPVVDDDVI